MKCVIVYLLLAEFTLVVLISLEFVNTSLDFRLGSSLP